jgi:hypothetical protein
MIAAKLGIGYEFFFGGETPVLIKSMRESMRK